MHVRDRYLGEVNVLKNVLHMSLRLIDIFVENFKKKLDAFGTTPIYFSRGIHQAFQNKYKNNKNTCLK